jgi:hypothetical protein
MKERGCVEVIDVINRDMPSVYSYSYEPPPMAEYWNQPKSPYSGYPEHRQNTKHENEFPIKTASSQVAPRRPTDYERERPKSLSVSKPPEILRREREASKPARSEVRFTLPRAQLVSNAADTTNESQPSELNPNVPKTPRMDDELPKLHKKVEEVIKKREECVRSGDHTTAADLTYYAIPDLEKRIKVLKEEQREEQKKRSAPLPRNDEYRKSHHTEVETESEDSDDDGASEIQDLR